MNTAANNEVYDDVEGLIDLRSVWFGFRRRAALFVGVVVAIFAGIAAYAFLSTELYTAEASIIIEPKNQVFAYGAEVLPQNAADPTRVDTEVELLRSRAMALRVSSRLLASEQGGDAAQINNADKRNNDFFSRRLADIAQDLARLQSSESDAGPSSDLGPTPGDANVVDGPEDQDTSQPDAGEIAADASASSSGDRAASTSAADAIDAEGSLENVSNDEGVGGADDFVTANDIVETDSASESDGAKLASANETGAADDGDLQLTELPEAGRSVDTAFIYMLMKNLEIQRIGTTFLIEIRHSHSSPKMAADIANAYAEEYILQQLEAQYDELRQANNWIDARLAALREEVRAAETAASNYRAEQGLVDVTGESFSEKAISGIATELSAARTNLASVRARYETVRELVASGAPVDSISEVMTSPVIAELRRQEVELYRELAELKVRYGDRHPEVLKAREDYAELSQQFEREKNRIIDSLRSEVNFAAAQVRSLERNLGEAQIDMASSNAAMVTLLELERDIDATRGVYEALLNRQKELNERDQLANANARIIARAEPPSEPTRPRKKLILAGGLLLGLLFAGASTFTAEALDTRVRNTQDIRREFGPNAPVVLIPRIQSRMLFRNRRCDDIVRQYILEKPESLFASSLRDLRMYLKAAEREGGVDRAPTIAVTSVFRNEGATTTAFALASTLATGGKKVAFINHSSPSEQFFKNTADLEEVAPRRLPKAQMDMADAGEDANGALAESSLAVAADGERHGGAGDLTTVEETKNSVSRTTEIELLPPRTVCGVEHMEIDTDAYAFEEFDVAAFDRLVANMREEFDYIVIDAPSILSKNEGSMVAAAAEYTILVTEWCSTTRGAARAATQRLLHMGATILSFVVTKVDRKQKYYFRPEDQQFFYQKNV